MSMSNALAALPAGTPERAAYDEALHAITTHRYSTAQGPMDAMARMRKLRMSDTIRLAALDGFLDGVEALRESVRRPL